MGKGLFAFAAAAAGLVAALAALLSTAGCASTRLVNVWTAPERPAPLRNVLVAGLSSNDAQRRTFEDVFAARLRALGVKATPAYDVLPQGRPDAATVRRAMQDGGFDGAVTARLVAVDTRPDDVYVGFRPGTLYRPFWDDYVFGYDQVYAPGYLATTRVVRVETKVFEARDGKSALVWVADSETVDPQNVREGSADFAEVVTKELRRAGLI